MCFAMFLKFPVSGRRWGEEALSGALGADFGGQEGVPRRPKRSRNAAPKRSENDLKIELVLEAVLEFQTRHKRILVQMGLSLFREPS